nr:hypothetical protein [Tanacetum cinerariifolium]
MILQSFPLLRKSILFSMSSPRLLYDNSSPRPLEDFNFENSNAEIEYFSPSPIPNEDSDSFMEEIDLFLTPDDPMPPSIEDDEDSEGDILFLERLHYPLSSIPENLKILARGFYPPSLNFLSFNWESCIQILSTNVFLLTYFINGLRFT